MFKGYYDGGFHKNVLGAVDDIITVSHSLYTNREGLRR
jgi:hypothetical protein